MHKTCQVVAPGMRIGLFGGSFNPAHDGHVHVTRMAMRALHLDRVWWLVSPGNPLKTDKGMAPVEVRMQKAQALVSSHPCIDVSDMEVRFGTRYTVDTISILTKRHPGVRFVWLMGADNFIQFPQWVQWKKIASSIPVAVYPRPGYTLRARLSKAAACLSGYELRTDDAARLAFQSPPCLVFLQGRQSSLSSTAIREGGAGYS